MGTIAVYWKAIIAFCGALGAFLLGLSTNSALAEVFSPELIGSLGSAAVVLTGIGTWAKGNAKAKIKGAQATAVVADAAATIREARAAADEMEKRARASRQDVEAAVSDLAGRIVRGPADLIGQAVDSLGRR